MKADEIFLQRRENSGSKMVTLTKGPQKRTYDGLLAACWFLGTVEGLLLHKNKSKMVLKLIVLKDFTMAALHMTIQRVVFVLEWIVVHRWLRRGIKEFVNHRALSSCSLWVCFCHHSFWMGIKKVGQIWFLFLAKRKSKHVLSKIQLFF